jgi:hypothetical protein
LVSEQTAKLRDGLNAPKLDEELCTLVVVGDLGNILLGLEILVGFKTRLRKRLKNEKWNVQRSSKKLSSYRG